ncbi:Molybdopterin or thiamine biosynthesis adenylyltransferase [Natronincola peptidivorans]|uniref:Molybdopterin or thiamine biosynthesis adenylyltransferase n=1 Tax=Natronincola peptidivorans TaxID=426128 RepID=A0A1I0ARG9_9FIRM|nr:HesA/MoeB/ThiF family protein [Natronincola peptidivorans]SES96549.1 Molybdopterin or thiamine biosynthesis adenylyltransferase [Natronincola peptidivorans]
MKRYERNMQMLSLEENEKLKEYKVCVIGCGGLGGYVIEMLGRLGIGFITAVDGDEFEASNLNRQLFANEEVLGKSKATTAKERMAIVNSLIHVNAITSRLTSENSEEILTGHDIVVDALDNIESRFVLQEACEKLKIPMVHGAIAGWYGQITTIFPGDNTLQKIYTKKDMKGVEKELGNPSFTPALVASIQVSEVVKLLIGRGELLRNKILFINTLDTDYYIAEF